MVDYNRLQWAFPKEDLILSTICENKKDKIYECKTWRLVVDLV